MSKWLALAFALATVLLQVFSQLALKHRIIELSQGGFRLDGALPYLAALLRDPWILAALASAFLGMLTWMLALVRLPLSQAYPFVALTIPLVALLGAGMFSEVIPPLRAAGLTAIIIGVLLVALG